MKTRLSPLGILCAILLAGALPQSATAQLGLPSLPAAPVPALPEVDTVGGLPAAEVVERLEGLTGSARARAIRLLNTRERILNRLLSRNRDLIERDADGNLARRGRLLATGLGNSGAAKLADAGFIVARREQIEGLDLEIVTLELPPKLDLPTAQFLARSLVPDVEFSPDHLHQQAGSQTAQTLMVTQTSPAIRTEVGMIDGAPGKAVPTSSVRGFAKGAPYPSNHGSSVASLLRSAGVSRVRVADVYGTDPAGGNALAIAKAIGWLTASGSKVISISLVGPRNSVVSKAISSAQRKGVIVVAAVGNDGPAAPPAYPASYRGVVAITAVDHKGRALIEAGKALNLDYAAPGAGIYATNAKGKRVKLRGTSFATPLAAARIAYARQRSAAWQRLVDAEARDLGKKGPDRVFGRGLVCGECAKRK